MQAYSKELYDLYANGAFKLQIWKEGYPFTADGMRQAQDDLGKTTLPLATRQRVSLLIQYLPI